MKPSRIDVLWCKESNAPICEEKRTLARSSSLSIILSTEVDWGRLRGVRAAVSWAGMYGFQYLVIKPSQLSRSRIIGDNLMMNSELFFHQTTANRSSQAWCHYVQITPIKTWKNLHTVLEQSLIVKLTLVYVICLVRGYMIKRTFWKKYGSDEIVGHDVHRLWKASFLKCRVYDLICLEEYSKFYLLTVEQLDSFLLLPNNAQDWTN